MCSRKVTRYRVTLLTLCFFYLYIIHFTTTTSAIEIDCLLYYIVLGFRRSMIQIMKSYNPLCLDLYQLGNQITKEKIYRVVIAPLCFFFIYHFDCTYLFLISPKLTSPPS